MAMTRLAVLFLLVCFLAGVSCGEDNGTEKSKEKKTPNEKMYDDQLWKDWTKYSGGSYTDGSKYPGSPYTDWLKYYGGYSNWSTHFGGSSSDWSKYMGGNYPTSLGAGVSWGPFIPLGMPIPDPCYYPYGYWSGKGKGADSSKGKGTSQGSQEVE